MPIQPGDFLALTLPNGDPVWVLGANILKITLQEDGGSVIELIRGSVTVKEVPGAVMAKMQFPPTK